MKYYDYRDTWKGEWIMAVFVRIRGKEGKKNAKIWQKISLERLKSFLLKLQCLFIHKKIGILSFFRWEHLIIWKYFAKIIAKIKN